MDVRGWADYLPWQGQDRTTLKRINSLTEDILRGDLFEGLGKPEALKHALSGAWTRRIDEANRLVNFVDDRDVIILQARCHY
ncbi:MAG TPA: Txe/YoeB family addiction module toxin [Galbitalea sp.]|nr:Txe/YoeB family addiction module toxin [Galbitalea sp.]